MRAIGLAFLVGAVATPAAAIKISILVLDLARSVGGKAVPLTLSERSTDGRWQKVGAATTDNNDEFAASAMPSLSTLASPSSSIDRTRYPDTLASSFSNYTRVPG